MEWTPPSPLPRLLPWTVLLLLLLLVPENRHPYAWLAPAPYLLLAIVQSQSGLLGELMESSSAATLLSVLKSVAFALGVVWLLLPWLKAGHRFVAFLKSLPTGIAAGVLALIGEQAGTDLPGMLAGIAILITAILLVLLLTGWRCKKRYNALTICGWSLGWSALFAMLAIGLTAGVSSIAGGGLPSPSELSAITAVCVGLLWGLLLPFLVISLSNRFYGERLRNWMLVLETTQPLKAPQAQPTTTSV